jgi:hypothetical protein
MAGLQYARAVPGNQYDFADRESLRGFLSALAILGNARAERNHPASRGAFVVNRD